MDSFRGMGVWGEETFLQKGPLPQRLFPKVDLSNVLCSHQCHSLDPVRFFRFDFEAGFELADRFSQLRGQLVRHLFGRFNLVG